MLDYLRRRTPDELLAEIEMEERRKQRGKLKVFLGYVSGKFGSHSDAGYRKVAGGTNAAKTWLCVLCSRITRSTFGQSLSSWRSFRRS